MNSTSPKHARRGLTRSIRRAASVHHSRTIGPNATLVESDEYEFASPLCMPGLLVAIDQICPPAVVHLTRAAAPQADELLSTEDGDTRSVCQLPGRIVGESSSTERIVPARPEDEPDGLDEYTERAATQWPGLIVIPSPTPEPPRRNRPRGLCADCLVREDCQFPKPESGVWRCEEYR